MSGNLRPRIHNLNLVRIVCALCVIGAHSEVHLNTSYHWMSHFVWSGPSMMTLFFMLSGFVVAYNYHDSKVEAHEFYKRRVVGLMPGYWSFLLLAALYDIVWIWISEPAALGEYLHKVAWVLPVDVVGLQSAIPYSTFTFSHNGGTWFVSCLIFCLLLYPGMRIILNKVGLRTRIWLLLANLVVINLMVIFREELGISWVYTFIPFRVLNFSVGVLAASIPASRVSALRLDKQVWVVVWSCAIVAVLTLLGKEGVKVTLRGTLTSPLYVLLILSLAYAPTFKLAQKRLVKYLASLALMIFLCEYFCWDFLEWIFAHPGIPDWNWLKIVVMYSVIIAVAALIHEVVEKPLKQQFKKFFSPREARVSRSSI